MKSQVNHDLHGPVAADARAFRYRCAWSDSCAPYVRLALPQLSAWLREGAPYIRTYVESMGKRAAVFALKIAFASAFHAAFYAPFLSSLLAPLVYVSLHRSRWLGCRRASPIYVSGVPFMCAEVSRRWGRLDSLALIWQFRREREADEWRLQPRSARLGLARLASSRHCSTSLNH